MHAEREHAVVAGKDRVRAVALVNVEIDDRGATDAASVLQGPNGDRDVVEDAKPFPMIGEGVVSATGEIHRNAVLERGRRGLAGAANGAERSFDERGRPWEAEESEFLL